MKRVHEYCYKLNCLACDVLRMAKAGKSTEISTGLLIKEMNEMERQIGHSIGDIFVLNLFGEHDLIKLVEQLLIDKDDTGRKFLLSRIFDEYQEIFYFAGHSSEIMKAIRDYVILNDKLAEFVDNINDAICFVAGYICLFCKDLNLSPKLLAGYEIEENVLNYWVAARRQLISSKEKYETMPSTHRRAAVMALIDKSGLCKNIDRTKKAAFVEAVTGGNINANPKDSVSYKKPEQKAIDAASELLKTIGIE